MEKVILKIEEKEICKITDTREVCTTEVPINPPLEDLIVTPKVEEQHFKSNKYGYDNITVKAVENIQPQINTQNELLNYQAELLTMSKIMLTQLGYIN